MLLRGRMSAGCPQASRSADASLRVLRHVRARCEPLCERIGEGDRARSRDGSRLKWRHASPVDCVAVKRPGSCRPNDVPGSRESTPIS